LIGTATVAPRGPRGGAPLAAGTDPLYPRPPPRCQCARWTETVDPESLNGLPTVSFSAPARTEIKLSSAHPRAPRISCWRRSRSGVGVGHHLRDVPKTSFLTCLPVALRDSCPSVTLRSPALITAAAKQRFSKVDCLIGSQFTTARAPNSHQPNASYLSHFSRPCVSKGWRSSGDTFSVRTPNSTPDCHS